MGKFHGNQTLEFDEKSNLSPHISSTREENHWMQMGIQGQV
jgi:hypothetical protein